MVVEAVIGGYGTDSWHDLLLHVPDNDKGKLAGRLPTPLPLAGTVRRRCVPRASGAARSIDRLWPLLVPVDLVLD